MCFVKVKLTLPLTLSSPCTTSNHDLLVNAFRRRIRDERPNKLARTKRPEMHRPRGIIKPRDKATSDPDTSHYAQRTAGKMTGASPVSSHSPRLVRARKSRSAYGRDCVSQQIVHNFFFFFTLLYIIDMTRKNTPLKWNHVKISGNRSVAVKSKVDTLEIVLSSHFSLRFHQTHFIIPG